LACKQRFEAPSGAVSRLDTSRKHPLILRRAKSLP
jgi:hypothetical protein